MNFVNRRSNRKMKTIFHQPAHSRTREPFASRPKHLTKLSPICASTPRVLTSTLSHVSALFSWSQDRRLTKPPLPKIACS